MVNDKRLPASPRAFQITPFMFPHPVPATQYKKKFFFVLFKVDSYKSKPTHTDVKWDRSQIYGLVSHDFSDTPGTIEDGINSIQILVKEFRGAAWTLYSLEAGLFSFFSPSWGWLHVNRTHM